MKTVSCYYIIFTYLFLSIPGQLQDKFDQPKGKDMTMTLKSFSVQF